MEKKSEMQMNKRTNAMDLNTEPPYR
jgi:hypothetical protein